MNDILSKLELYLLQNGRKQSTVTVHLKALKLILRYSPRLDYQTNIKFLLNLQKQNKRHTYLNNLIDTLRVTKNVYPSLEIPPYFKEEVFIKATMNDEEIDTFVNLPVPTFLCRYKSGKAVRKVADPDGWNMFTVFWHICAYSGMRMGEVAHMTVDRVDFGRQVFVLEDTKTNTPRFVPIAPNIRPLLTEYIAGLKGDLLFPARRGGGDGTIDGTDWVYNFDRRIKIMGIKRKNLTPYSLRHSMCTRLLEEDVSFPKIMKIMGHKQASTTLQYEHLTTKDIQRAITKLPNIRRGTDPQSILQAFSDLIRSFQFQADNRFTFELKEGGKEIRLAVKINELSS